MRVVFDLGSNIEREASLAKAVQLLSKHFRLQKSSSIYESDPVGIKEQPNFLNFSLEAKSEKTATDIRSLCRLVEDEMGRDRSGPKYGPRIIDIDILLYGNTVDLKLKLPHPQTTSELFVVQPLSELYPEGKHPGLGLPWTAIRKRLLNGRSLEESGIRLYGALNRLPLDLKNLDLS